MKDQNIYKQAVQEIVADTENDFLSAADIRRIAELAEKYYRQGFEDAQRNDINKEKEYIYVLFGKNSSLEVEDEKYGGEVLGYFSTYEMANTRANAIQGEWMELKILEAPLSKPFPEA